MERCVRCGAAFACGAGTGSCWCAGFELPAGAAEAARELGDTCLCPACLQVLAAGGGAPIRITSWPLPPPSTR